MPFESTPNNRRIPARRERGFAAVAAVFLIVIIGGIGTALLTTTKTAALNQARDMLGIQAFQAARAGLDLGAYLAARNNWDCTTTQTQTLTLPDSLSRFTVLVGCDQTDHLQGAATTKVWRITATACNQATCPGTADANYIERRLRSSVIQ